MNFIAAFQLWIMVAALIAGALLTSWVVGMAICWVLKTLRAR